MKGSMFVAIVGLGVGAAQVTRSQVATPEPPAPSARGEAEGGFGVTGIVSHVDRDANALIIMAPTSKATEVEQIGRTAYIDRETNLIAIRATVDRSAPLVRDGKSAQIQDIKEGDVVRTTYDPARPRFVGIVAVSQAQIGRDKDKAEKVLGEQSKALDKAGRSPERP